ncbi:MAG TPA: AMP-binding protein [Nitriliruptorales bacterium]
MSGNELRGAAADPGAGNAPLVVRDVGAMFRRNAARFRNNPAVLFEDRVWTHGELAAKCASFAGLLRELGPDADGRTHVGMLADNGPGWLLALGGAGIAGATLVGLNTTRTAEGLVRDARHANVSILVHDDRHPDAVEALRGIVPENRIVHADDLEDTIAPHDARAIPDPSVDETWCLVFTSGSSGDPKAVICSQRRMLTTGERMRIVLDITTNDVGYVSMPLFHSNSLMVGVMPALIAGAAVALAPRFSASGWLPDVRRYGATWFNYTGKPLAYVLATSEQPDDADNRMRRGFGNEGSATTVEAFQKRFGVELIDAFGPTEGGIAILPDDTTPPGALGRPGEHVKVVAEDGAEMPIGEVGEIVNLAGPGPFEGYWNDPEATERATRFGWYWTGDLGLVDEDGFLWFAGRADDWLRVDGENFAATPIERAVATHPDVVVAAVYAVPDAEAGDQVMAALVLREDAMFDGNAFAMWFDEDSGLAPKHRPRFLRTSTTLPTTGTNKILTRQLRREKFRLDQAGSDAIWHRPDREGPFVPFDRDAEAALHEQFIASGRDRFWEA